MKQLTRRQSRSRKRRHCPQCLEVWGFWTMTCPRCERRTPMMTALIVVGFLAFLLLLLEALT